MCSKLSLFQTLQTPPPSYHQCNQRQLGIKTATDQRHKVGDKCPCSALSLPSHLSALDRKLKTCAQKGKKILKGRMTLLNFLSRLQITIENYAMTAFSIQPIRAYGQQTMFPHLRVAIANFQYR